MIEQLFSTCEALESIPGTNKKGEERKKERKTKKLRNKTNVFPISVLPILVTDPGANMR